MQRAKFALPSMVTLMSIACGFGSIVISVDNALIGSARDYRLAAVLLVLAWAFVLAAGAGDAVMTGMKNATRLGVGLMVIFAVANVFRARLVERLPDTELLEDVMYKSISAGFAFFTIATILGALWAAEAWGGYWSWDPKETWALIVWLNYAAWLHMRLMSGLRGKAGAWWALAGLVVTTFAFLGVNMFLSGLHSYGKL